MNTPVDLKYTKSHEWIRLEGNRAYVGITDYAQDNLGDIVYIDLPEVGREVDTDEELTTIESVKAAEPIFAPLKGVLVEVNEALVDNPELINEDPYGSHIFVIEVVDNSEYDSLLDSTGYNNFVSEEQ